MEMSRIELVEERQKWQHAYQSLALACENGDSGIASRVSSPLDSLTSSSNPSTRDSGVRELNPASDEVPTSDAIAQVRTICEPLFDPGISNVIITLSLNSSWM